MFLIAAEISKIQNKLKKYLNFECMDVVTGGQRLPY
jgi:hypothetical protein